MPRAQRRRFSRSVRRLAAARRVRVTTSAFAVALPTTPATSTSGTPAVTIAARAAAAAQPARSPAGASHPARRPAPSARAARQGRLRPQPRRRAPLTRPQDSPVLQYWQPRTRGWLRLRSARRSTRARQQGARHRRAALIARAPSARRTQRRQVDDVTLDQCAQRRSVVVQARRSPRQRPALSPATVHQPLTEQAAQPT